MDTFQQPGPEFLSLAGGVYGAGEGRHMFKFQHDSHSMELLNSFDIDIVV